MKTETRLLLGCSLLFGLFVYACLPAEVVPLDDDFGYLRSVVATLQHHRPWTDDWLEPWAASFSFISASLYRVTGNFYFATYGLLALLSSVSFGICSALLRMKGISLPRALLFAALLLTFPTVFWKTVQYTSLALYIPCLLGAIWSGLNRQWWIFLLAWSLALAARQSAIAWIMIPLTVAVENGLREKRFGTKDIWRPILVALLGVALFLILKNSMNKTHAQTVITDHYFEHGSAEGMLRVILIGSGVYFAAAGLGPLIARFGQTKRIGGGDLRSLAPISAIVILVFTLSLIDLRSLLNWEHGMLSGTTGFWYLKFLVIAGGTGWILRRTVILPEFAACAAATLLAVSMRAAVWDYYFLDLAVLGLFGQSLRMEPTTAPFVSPQWLRWAARLGLAGVCLVHGLLVLDFKVWLDGGMILCLMSEEALRDGRIKPDELSFSPFGFTAWHLYPHYIENEGLNNPQIDGFNAYLRPNVMEVVQGHSGLLDIYPQFRHVTPADRRNLVAECHTRHLWFFSAEYYLLRFKTDAESLANTRLSPTYRPAPFPLNEAEWRNLILKFPL